MKEVSQEVKKKRRDKYLNYIEKAKRENRCVTCGNPKERPDLCHCNECRKRRHDYAKKYYQDRKKERLSAGLCITCGKVNDTHMQQCQACADAKKGYNNQAYQSRLRNGICTYCGKEKADFGYTRCYKCRVIGAARIRTARKYERMA